MKHISPFVMALLFLFITGYQELEAQQYIRYRKTVFEAGKDGIDSYRIPSLVVTPKGTMLAFCEARKISSTDKTPTDIAVKRSTDKGKTWSQIQFLTGGNKEAYMDPVALVNQPTGTILLFANRWPPGDRSMRENTAWLIKSSDDGQTWSEPENITASLLAPGHLLNGFGPGSGTQMQGPRFKNRLVLPTRQSDGQGLRNRTAFSDDGGKTWIIGNPADVGGEYDITEVAPDTLFYTLRAGQGLRKKGWSYDGGGSWTNAIEDSLINTTAHYGGCQSSVLAIDDVLLFTGPAGGSPDERHEDRQNLTIYRSLDKGNSWKDRLLLFDKAAGYSNITQLPTGEVAVIFEAADTKGFPKMLPGYRPPGWMRLDVLILSKSILKGKWKQGKEHATVKKSIRKK